MIQPRLQALMLILLLQDTGVGFAQTSPTTTVSTAPASDLQARLNRLDAEVLRHPENFHLRFERALALSDLGRVEESLSAFTSISDELPGVADPLNNIGVLRAGRGDLEGARLALEQALRIQPQHVQATRNLAEIYVRLAISLWQRNATDPQWGEESARKLRLARNLIEPLSHDPSRSLNP